MNKDLKNTFCLRTDLEEIAVGTIDEIAEVLLDIHPDITLQLANCSTASEVINCVDIRPSYGEDLANAVKRLHFHENNEVLSELYGEG